jgi:hypothetical protein
MKLQHEASTNSLDMGLVDKGKVRIIKNKTHMNTGNFMQIQRHLYVYI